MLLLLQKEYIMASDFDPLDRDSWYFGLIARDESVQILNEEREGGAFLVRDSTSIPGDYVLCVKEVRDFVHSLYGSFFEMYHLWHYAHSKVLTLKTYMPRTKCPADATSSYL